MLTQTATITYTRPARGNLRANGAIADERRRGMLDALARGERAARAVPVTLTDDEGREVTSLRETCALLPRTQA